MKSLAAEGKAFQRDLDEPNEIHGFAGTEGGFGRQAQRGR